MAFPTVEELTAIITPIAEAHGMDVEHVRAVRAGKKSQIVIALDSDAHPTLDELEVVSNEIGELFDASEDQGTLNLGPGYTLEVTTPGVEHPLTLARHWRRNRGRAVVITGEDGKESKWRIGALSADETKVILVRRGVKQSEVNAAIVSEIPKAVVEIEFNAPPAAEQEIVDASFEEAEQAITR